MKNIVSILLFSLFFLACNEDGNKTSSDNQEKSKLGTCEYTLNAEAVKLEWTAFKTTEKIAVKGTFDEINFENKETNTDFLSLLIDSKFEIVLNSVNSGNEERDEKLRTFVFGSMDNNQLFTGFIEECDGDENSGKMIVNLSINDISNQVKMKYKLDENNILNIKGTLDLLDWDAQKSVDSIHEACLELHKGADGVSKTWSEMEILVLIPLDKNCQ